MIVPFATFWSRVHKRKVPVLYARVSNLEIVQAVTEVGARLKQPVVLCFHAEQAPAYPFDIFLASAYRLALRSPELVILQLDVAGDRETLAVAASYPAQVYNFDTDTSFAEGWNLARKMLPPDVALSITSSLIANPNDIIERVRMLSAETLILKGGGEVSATFVAETIKAIRIPVILEADSLAPRETKRLLKTGINALYLGRLLEEAYLSGIRTALRDRSLSDPGKASAYGVKALTAALEHHINLIRP